MHFLTFSIYVRWQYFLKKKTQSKQKKLTEILDKGRKNPPVRNSLKSIFSRSTAPATISIQFLIFQAIRFIQYVKIFLSKTNCFIKYFTGTLSMNVDSEDTFFLMSYKTRCFNSWNYSTEEFNFVFSKIIYSTTVFLRCILRLLNLECDFLRHCIVV